VTVVGRLAPSPTGRLHLGHARSFLLAWWSARSQGGRVVLRIDDLDADRVREGAADGILEDLRWLGLDWDGEPLLQSERAGAHAEALAGLREAGAVYPCVCTRRELAEAASAPHGHGGEVPYPGTCREDPGRTAAAPPDQVAWRLRVPRESVRWEDLVAGPQAHSPHGEAGDFVVARKGGGASYQLATVVDDAHQGVTEVVRGDDLLPSAARQRLVAGALGLPSPAQAHVPLVLDHQGARLAKRDQAITLAELRAGGMDPRRVCRWAARSAGLTETEQPRPAKFWADRPILNTMQRDPVRLPPSPADDL
jgi:glutamyl-tRNA synthetase